MVNCKPIFCWSLLILPFSMLSFFHSILGSTLIKAKLLFLKTIEHRNFTYLSSSNLYLKQSYSCATVEYYRSFIAMSGDARWKRRQEDGELFYRSTSVFIQMLSDSAPLPSAGAQLKGKSKRRNIF